MHTLPRPIQGAKPTVWVCQVLCRPVQLWQRQVCALRALRPAPRLQRDHERVLWRHMQHNTVLLLLCGGCWRVVSLHAMLLGKVMHLGGQRRAGRPQLLTFVTQIRHAALDSVHLRCCLG